jgi:hypothetical protein
VDPPDPAPRDATLPAMACTLRVEAVFRELGEQQLEAVAAAMIDRAHELANRPECECDVDVSVERGAPDIPAETDPGGGAGAAASAREP